jgi:predicted permease
VLATDYPFLDLMWTMAVFFIWILWLWLLFTVFADIFRRRDISGLGKTAWIVFAILLPFLGVFVYLMARGSQMADRDTAQVLEQANLADVDKIVAALRRTAEY